MSNLNAACPKCGCTGIHACLGRRVVVSDLEKHQLSAGIARVADLDKALMEYQGKTAKIGSVKR